MDLNTYDPELWGKLILPRKNLQIVQDLYLRYKDDLMVVKERQQHLYSIRGSIGLQPQLCDIEAEITYLMIREFRPETVVEISPASGWSTSWILQALKDNAYGTLFSYDLVDDSIFVIPKRLSGNRWRFFKGDIQMCLDELPKNIDYLFLDSDHSANFAEWYIEHLFPMLRGGVRVSVHDILKFPSDPGWGKESTVLCSWLVENGIGCMTASKALKESGYSTIGKLRVELGLDMEIEPSKYNSMIFFNL